MFQTRLSLHFLRPRVGSVGFYFYPLYLIHKLRILTNTHNFARTGRYFRAATGQNYSTTAQRSCCDLFIITKQQSHHKMLLKIWKWIVVTWLIPTLHTSPVDLPEVNKVHSLFWKRERERERERETYRQTERERERERETYRQTDRERETHTHRDRQTERETYIHTDRQTERDTHTQSDREREREREREKKRERGQWINLVVFPSFYKADNFHFCDFSCALRGANYFLLE